MRLFSLWLLISALITGLTLINPSQFTSVDSGYYLSMAGWLVGLDGSGYGHVSAGWESTFPVGYPLLIGWLARLTGLSLLVASKVLNSLLVAFFLYVWHRRLGAGTALWMGSVLLLGGFLRVLTYTWSEWAFVVVLGEWLWLDSHRPASLTYRYTGRLALLAIGLFLLRYVGGYVVVAYALRTLVAYTRSSWPTVRRRLGPDLLYGVGAIAFMVAYFMLNNWLTASPYGGDRFVETTETTPEKWGLIAWAIVNEGLLLRDYVPGEPTGLVWLGLLVQAGLLLGLWRLVWPRRHTLPAPSGTLKKLFASWAWASGTYLAVLFTMRFFSPFSGPNARLMAIVTLPLLLGLAAWVSQWPHLTRRRQMARWWGIVLLASWLQLLPQAELEAKLRRVFTAKTVTQKIPG